MQVKNSLWQILIDQSQHPATTANSIIDIEFYIFAVNLPEFFNRLAIQWPERAKQAKADASRRISRVPPWTSGAIGIIRFPLEVI